MVLKFFKRKTSSRNISAGDVEPPPSASSRGRKPQSQEKLASSEGTNNTSRRRIKMGALSRKSTPRTISDETTSSDVSGISLTTMLESFARDGKWDSFLEMVTKSTLDDWNKIPVSSEKKILEPNTTTPLHIAMYHRPSVEVVGALITLMKEQFNVTVPEETQDARGRTPLHVGAAHHCNEHVTERLLTGDNLIMPAVIRDKQGRTPLHLAAGSPIVKPKKQSFFGKNRVQEDRWSKRRMIFLLLNHYPEAATLTDAHGKTPLQYALENKSVSESSITFIKRMEQIHAPEEASKELDSSAPIKEEDLKSLQSLVDDASIPSIVSHDWSICSGSIASGRSFASDGSFACRGSFKMAPQSVGKAASALLGDMDREDDDECEGPYDDGVSSIGYHEAEMYNA